MVTQCRTAPRCESAPTAQTILRVWRGDRSINAPCAQQYLYWIDRFRRYCRELGMAEVNELTRDGAKRFQAWYAASHGIDLARVYHAHSAVRGLRRVYEVMGVSMPAWSPPKSRPLPATAVLRDYAAHLRQHRGKPESTIHAKLDHVGKLIEHLAHRGKSWRRMSLTDLDAFLIDCTHRYARSTTAGIASTVRCFTRFLLASGRIHVDLSDAVISPVQPRFERPRRALPWEDVQRLLRAVDTSTARGLRDYAMLLMMSTYGLGAGEVIGLQLQDIDWKAEVLRMSRPKTGVDFVLPLLPSVARALAQYLQHGRPPHTPTRHVFVQMMVPFGALTSASAVRHVLIRHAKAAGIQASYLGSHVLRHSNAARQIDTGTRAAVLSALLGQRDPESVSAYLRIATQSLREVSLPVPR